MNRTRGFLIRGITGLFVLCISAWTLSAQESGRLSLRFIGDLMMHGRQIRAAQQSDGTYVYDSVFKYIAPRLQEAHIVVANIETTFNGTPYSGYPSFSAPIAYAQAAQRAGINVLLTANNHITDRGERGVRRTLNALDSIGILHLGVYPNQAARAQRTPLLIEKNGITVALLNYTYGVNVGIGNSPIVINKLDSAQIAADVALARSQADFVICCVHWGEEYHLEHNAYQKAWAQRLRDFGAHAVIGSHPHVIQGIEVDYPFFFTAYSLGNVVSNQEFPNTRVGLMVGFDLVRTPNGVQIDTPFYEWLWTLRAEIDGLTHYRIVPVSDPRIYRTLTENPADTTAALANLATLRAFMQKAAPNIPERKRYPPYERKSLYFGAHTPFFPVWAQQPVSSFIEREFPAVENHSARRRD